MKIQYTTHIEAEILEKVREISEIERRSLNNTVEFLLEKAIEYYEKEKSVANQ